MAASIIRTLVPYIVGVVLALAARAGLHLPAGEVTVWVGVALAGIYYTASRYVEKRWPGIGRWLLSLGLTSRQPVYVAGGGKVIQDRTEPVP